MKNKFKDKYNVNWTSKNNVSGELGIFVKNEYRKSNIKVSVITESIIPSLIALIKKKIEKDEIHIMEYNNHSTSELYLLQIKDDFLNPLENIVEIEPERYDYLFENRGNIIVLALKIQNKKYDIFISDTGADILGKGGIFKLNNQPNKLKRENTLIINPNNLICIKDYTEHILIIKDTKRASKLFGLDEFFENKARTILGYTVENVMDLKLKKANIDRILKKSECYTLEYINNNKKNFISVMKENGIKYIHDNSDILSQNGNPRIILKNNEISLYIDGLNKIIEKNPISGEEREVVR